MIFINSNWQNSWTNFTTVNFQKHAANFFNRFPLFILTKPHSLVWKTILFNMFHAKLERNQFFIGICPIRNLKAKDVQQKAVPLSAFCKMFIVISRYIVISQCKVSKTKFLVY